MIAPDLTDEAAIEVDHAEVGAAWLARWFPPSVSEPVRLHVEAKRYLATVEPDRVDTVRRIDPDLGVAGWADVQHRGAWVQAHRFGSAAIELRRLDEKAKAPEFDPPPIGHFLTVLREVLTTV